MNRSIYILGLMLMAMGCKVDTAIDITPPNVISFSPEEDATNVQLEAIIFIVFDEPLDQLNLTNAIIITSTAGEVAGELEYDIPSNKLSFIPSNLFEVNTIYNVTLASSLTDLSNNMVEGITWSFTTIGDVVAPEIVLTNPINEETNVARDIVISFTFNEALDQDNINHESLRLLISGNEVNGLLTYDPILFKLIFTPTQLLNYATQYVVELAGSVTDEAENSVGATSLMFTTLAESDPARYEVSFTATWSQATHPNDFPANAHFSGLIGMTHTENTSLFTNGILASTGIKDMAELGSKTALLAEINQIINSGSAEALLSGGGINPSPSAVSLEFDIQLSHSLVSMVSMIAPSPDWFIAVEQLSLYNQGTWVSDTTVFVVSYDAGTDSGSTFTSPNQLTSPFVSIFEIVESPLASNGQVVPLGTMRFIRID